MEIATLIVGAVLFLFGPVSFGWVWKNYYNDEIGFPPAIVFSLMAMFVSISGSFVLATVS